ncbi:YqeG family HAD IIIA-type phosphatase [Staphylococcus simiae]|uniref:YqeG family HAD IIIA-type phosphatase n=1 Tax=Staphylococcus simiae TaxID=308354 RepID=UPI001F61F6A0|nr:YqeG family HAD IIIA-type phosphatase [Staphylococcus simiae]
MFNLKKYKNNFFPDAYADSVNDIDFQKIYDLGYRGIIFDIDSTLVPHGAEVTKDIELLFEEIHAIGLQTLFLSNNSDERIALFNKNIQTQYIPMANKPNTINYYKALDMLDMAPSKVIVIGDQIFTDILGANRSGIKSIMVKYLLHEGETTIGKKRKVEHALLSLFKLQQYVSTMTLPVMKKTKEKKRLSERSPLLYQAAVTKETLRRHLGNKLSKEVFATHQQTQLLPNQIYSYTSNLIKTGKGIDPELQYNKAYNIDKSAAKINGIVIRPGETFSFWKLVGKVNKKNGYKDGRVIVNNQVQAGTGGGLCNLANTINLLILHSPLTITEFHHHSDALAPEQGERKPLSNGTSVSYNYVDYCFKNETNQAMQLCLWVADNQLHATLRSEEPIPYEYDIVEEQHRFDKENDKYYRKSQIYKVTKNKTSGKLLDKTLVWDNRSEVMYDYDLIPQSQIVNH